MIDAESESLATLSINSDFSACRHSTRRRDSGVAPALWTEAEQSLGIVCACLPCLRPLYGRSLSGNPKGTAEKPVQNRNIRLMALTSKGSTIGRNSGDGSLARLSEDNTAISSFTAKVTMASRHEPSLGPERNQSFEVHVSDVENALSILALNSTFKLQTSP